ncbi:MAG: Gfo/Idh/MocA family oxidoreductase [Firmicutes bacterium]|nr:Gfo/Idh/MocA family oxidoreductase [Bacillota bacterium]
MLRVGIVGLGFMGRAHLANYLRLESEGVGVKLVSVCDIDEAKLKGQGSGGNINVGSGRFDLSKYNLYTSLDDMLDNEELDYLDITLPTYLHAEASIKALNRGLAVLCEKPMALNTRQCREMIDAARANGRPLMIAQCLRFWPAYEYLKQCVDDGRYGQVVSGYFFRGGGTPTWSYRNWLLDGTKSGGCLLDQHVHDVDTINWLFGLPERVSTIATNVIPGSGFDALSTNYLYSDGKVINAQDDWTLNGDFGFEMTYRVNFERANLVFSDGILRVNPNDGKSFVPELPRDDGYYREMRYFIDCLERGVRAEVADPESTMDTIRLAEAELRSANNGGEPVGIA